METNVSKIEDMFSEFKAMFSAVCILSKYDTANKYKELKTVVQEWMQKTHLPGKVSIPVSLKTVNGTIIFDFSENKFEVEFDAFNNDPMVWVIRTVTFNPIWMQAFTKLLLFYCNLDTIISTLRETRKELNRKLSFLIDFVDGVKDVGVVVEEIRNKLVVEAISEELTENP